MSLSLRGDVWYWRKKINGVAQVRSTKTADKKVAERLAAKWEHEAHEEIVVHGVVPITVGLLAKQYLHTKEGLTTHNAIASQLNRFKSLFQHQVKDVRLADVQKVINAGRDKGNKESSLSITVSYWNILMNFAAKQKYTVGPKLEPIKNFKPKERFLTEAEEAALIEAAKVPDEGTIGLNESGRFYRAINNDLLISLLDLGCRFNEAANLTWSQIDLERNTVFIKRSKRGIDSTHYMSQRLKTIMQLRWDAREDDDHVFPTKVGKYSEADWMRRLRKRAGLSSANGTVTLHTLRHTYANRMTQNGMTLPDIKALLGHSNIATTMRYIKTDAQDVAKRALAVQAAVAAKQK
ncbi:tyrosine-type recombinase/integrase [Variovorax sp. LG9.2]|uniref:tyrosine-type recombinase/integrase n=1 Tax=Variovorax sp. LG9.2 TaxID=3048626 RepID=UPI002B230562|nr:tyrosine-type recombinase/integrase [Variovorax sp. LG9.2]MEB0057285.1 tyrosine-type recombinase/integrase [Variovorax sp. LG9.2]